MTKGLAMRLLFIGAISTLFTLNTVAQSDYSMKVQHYRDSVDRAFADTATSILMKEDIPHFHHLNYFPINESYKVVAKFSRIENAKTVKMKTSGTRTPAYKPYGTLEFELDGTKQTLTLYRFADPSRPELKNHLLLAFIDATNGKYTYMGGRYLDYDVKDVKDEMVIDFNYAYNPYCAYNDKYSCVIPPLENRLEIPIEAGVKKFHD